MGRRILEITSMNVGRKFDIGITVFLKGEMHVIATYQGEYRNLMALLYDKFFVEDFGECKGIGRCGTCHVHILGGKEEWLKGEGNEPATLSKMDLVDVNSRLACQIMIDGKLDGLRIEVV